MNEIFKAYDSGATLGFVRLNSSGQVALTDGSSFENWGANGHDLSDYIVSLPEIGSGGGIYIEDFDPDSSIVTEGWYRIVIFERNGGSWDNTATKIEVQQLEWKGDAEAVLSAILMEKAAKMLTNKAIQNKTTGAIVYYDDDGVTPILTHTPAESTTTLTRTAS